jgi:hypothetical protein
MRDNNVTVNVSVGRRRHYFPLLAFIGFVIAFFWPLSLPGAWKWLELPYLVLLAVIWGIVYALSRTAASPPAPPEWMPPGPRDYTLI